MDQNRPNPQNSIAGTCATLAITMCHLASSLPKVWTPYCEAIG